MRRASDERVSLPRGLRAALALLALSSWTLLGLMAVLPPGGPNAHLLFDILASLAVLLTTADLVAVFAIAMSPGDPATRTQWAALLLVSTGAAVLARFVPVLRFATT